MTGLFKHPAFARSCSLPALPALSCHARFLSPLQVADGGAAVGRRGKMWLHRRGREGERGLESRGRRVYGRDSMRAAIYNDLFIHRTQLPKVNARGAEVPRVSACKMARLTIQKGQRKHNLHGNVREAVVWSASSRAMHQVVFPINVLVKR